MLLGGIEPLRTPSKQSLLQGGDDLIFAGNLGFGRRQPGLERFDSLKKSLRFSWETLAHRRSPYTKGETAHLKT
jgi:hypothetical protein